MRRPRDNQRSRVYIWERLVIPHDQRGVGRFRTIDEVVGFARPIWRAERGRYGRAKVEMPLFQSSSWGQRHALAHDDHRISLPLWARNPFVILHEMAHRLTPQDEAHGPRFVGVLIGLCARHLGLDRDYLLALAQETGVKVHEKSIGATPRYGLHRKVVDVIARCGPLTDIEIALELQVSYRAVRGASLTLIRSGAAKWMRNRLHLCAMVATVQTAGSPGSSAVGGNAQKRQPLVA